MANRIWSVILIFQCATLPFILPMTNSCLADVPDRIIMTVGEIRVIQFVNAIKVHVTRKGIIHLVHDHDSDWSVTALKTGVVAIEVKIQGEDPLITYIDVRPHSDPRKMSKPDIAHGVVDPILSQCNQASSPHQFSIKAIIELVDTADMDASGLDSQIGYKFSERGSSPSISAALNPHHADYKRDVVADPVVTSHLCQNISIRAGGEDEIESKTDEGHVVSAWKSHGLEINMKLLPLDQGKLRIPFSVSLRTPSRGQGTYGVSEVSSSIDITLNAKTLAAVINMSSTSKNTKYPTLIANIPIIGPLFRQLDDSKSVSKLLLWFEVVPST